MEFKNIFFCLTVILICTAVSFPQDTRIADDNAMTNELWKDGIKYEAKRAIVWAEKGSLTEQEIEEFAALVNQGIVDIEKYTGIKFDKKHYQAEKIEYFISPNAGIPHVSVDGKPYIYLKPRRVKNKNVPYIHETTHVIAFKNEKSLWLQEGFASHAETYVAAHYGGWTSAGDTFNPDSKPNEELARNHLKEEISKRILPLIGMNGTPLIFKDEEWKIYSFIFEDNKVAAPAFYHLSESFVKFFLEKVGMKKMRKLFEAQDTRAGILKITGKNVDEWKADWLKSLT